jgi:hypothetical protein|nr:MAG TPA: hypothetical protein [Caudoviricetes sp.]
MKDINNKKYEAAEEIKLILTENEITLNCFEEIVDFIIKDYKKEALFRKENEKLNSKDIAIAVKEVLEKRKTAQNTYF